MNEPSTPSADVWATPFQSIQSNNPPPPGQGWEEVSQVFVRYGQLWFVRAVPAAQPSNTTTTTGAQA